MDVSRFILLTIATGNDKVFIAILLSGYSTLQGYGLVICEYVKMFCQYCYRCRVVVTFLVCKKTVVKGQVVMTADDIIMSLLSGTDSPTRNNIWDVSQKPPHTHTGCVTVTILIYIFHMYQCFTAAYFYVHSDISSNFKFQNFLHLKDISALQQLGSYFCSSFLS